jgi:hypothetical protein
VTGHTPPWHLIPHPPSDIFRGPCKPILWFVFPKGLMRLITVRYFCLFIFLISYNLWEGNHQAILWNWPLTEYSRDPTTGAHATKDNIWFVAVCLIAQKSLSHSIPEINTINEWQMLWYIMNEIYIVNLHRTKFQVNLNQHIKYELKIFFEKLEKKWSN